MTSYNQLSQQQQIAVDRTTAKFLEAGRLARTLPDASQSALVDTLATLGESSHEDLSEAMRLILVASIQKTGHGYTESVSAAQRVTDEIESAPQKDETTPETTPRTPSWYTRAVGSLFTKFRDPFINTLVLACSPIPVLLGLATYLMPRVAGLPQTWFSMETVLMMWALGLVTGVAVTTRFSQGIGTTRDTPRRIDRRRQSGNEGDNDEPQ